MARLRRLYLPLDVEFFDNARILEAGEKASWLYLAMCCDSKRRMSDGLLSRRQVVALQVPGWQGRMQKLVACGLVTEIAVGQTWMITGFLERNYSAEQVEAGRERDRVRKQDSGRIPDGLRSVSGRTLSRREVEEKEEVEVEAERREAQAEGQGRAAFLAARDALSKKQASA